MTYLELLRETEKNMESPGRVPPKTPKTPPQATFGGFGGTPSGTSQKIEGLPEAPNPVSPLTTADARAPLPAPRPVQRAYRVLVRMDLNEPARWVTMVTTDADAVSAFTSADRQFGADRVLALDS